MTTLPFTERSTLAAQIRGRKAAVAAEVTAEFFNRHPDWRERYGERGWQLGIEDAGYHVEFLASAIEGGSPDAFRSYVMWTERMLGARGIAPSFVVENVRQVERSLAETLDRKQTEHVREYVEVACEGRDSSSVSTDGERQEGARGVFLQAALRGDRKAASVVALEQLAAGGSIEDVYLNVLQKSLYETGRLWESNRISVAQEHMVTAIIQGVMAQLYDRIELPAVPRGRMIVAGVRGELHQIGAHMIADVLECNGWDARFLGSDMPNDGILRAIEESGARLLGISATMLFNVPHVVRLVNDVRAAFPRESVRIIGGGAAFRVAPSLADDLGVDGCATDLRSAIALADRLIPATNVGS